MSTGITSLLTAWKSRKRDDPVLHTWVWQEIYYAYLYGYPEEVDYLDLFNALTGGFYLAEYPQQHNQSDIYPYCVVSLVNDKAKYTFRDKIYSLEIQFTLYDDSDTAETILDAGDKLKTKYDSMVFNGTGTQEIIGNTTLTVGYEPTGMTHLSERLIKRGDKWQLTIKYNFEYQRTVT